MNSLAEKLNAIALEWEREAASAFRCADMTRRKQAEGWEMGARLVEFGGWIKANHAAQLRKLASSLPEAGI